MFKIRTWAVGLLIGAMLLVPLVVLGRWDDWGIPVKGTAYQVLQTNSGASGFEWTSTLSIASLDLTSATSTIPWPVGTGTAPTGEGRAYWNSTTNRLTVGDGAIAQRVLMGSTASVVTPAASATLTVGLSNIYTYLATNNEDVTLTFSGAGNSGDEITIVFKTVSTDNEVITFHATLVSSTGTLTLGTTANRFYSIRFISDGAHWYEVSRTGEQT